MVTLPLCGTPTARPTCLFSEQTKYQWFLQSRVEVAVPIGNSTPPWGHRLLLLYGEKPQSYQHRQVGGELFLIGTDRKKKKKDQFTTTCTSSTRKQDRKPPPRNCQCLVAWKHAVALTRYAAKKLEHSGERVVMASCMASYPAYESCSLPPSYNSVPPVFIRILS